MRRGEVRWSCPPLPGARPKRRPFVIVSNDAFNLNERYPKVMVVHVTSVRRLGGPYGWEVELARGTAGLEQRSVVKCGEIYTLLKQHVGALLGTLPREQMERIDDALLVALGVRLRGTAPDWLG